MTHTLAVPAPDITSAAFKANPFPFYARLRAEAPVYPVEIRMRTTLRAWLVTRFDDVNALLKDDRFAKDPTHAKVPQIPGMFKALTRGMINLDEPDHGRLRNLVHKAFTPRMIESMRAEIQTLADSLLDSAEARGSIDIIADYALPLPLVTIGRMLGVPEGDNDRFHRWTQVFVSVGSSANMFTVVPTFLRFMQYLRRLIRERARQPKDDLISALTQAKEGGDHLTDDEILAMIFLLLSAGHETTVNLIGTGTYELMRHADQLDRLRADPTLIKPAVEEVLRYAVPAEMSSERYAKADTELHGVTIPRGELVLAVLGAANRDERFFDDPETFDIGRDPNRHVSFGQGAHYCLGAPLARLEGQIALQTLSLRFPNLKLAIPHDHVQWRGGLVLRGLKALPVTL
jgi:cytochrome P450 PksS